MTAKLFQYPATKDSRLPWLGQVPVHWEVSRLKRHLVRNDSGLWGDADERGTIVLRSTEQGVDGGWRISNPARIRLSRRERESARLATGDLVVTKSSGSQAHIGKTSLVSTEVAALDCCFSNFMQRLRPDARTDSSFLWYCLNSPVGREQLVLASNTTTGLGNLSGPILGNCRFAFPPLSEQTVIVRFLDHADRRIRQAIRAKQKLVALLNEQKQALIHHAVTRGLDPNVRLKPSGIDWLGDVPEHWEVTRLKDRVSFQEGPGIMAADFRVEGVPLLRISCLGGEEATLKGCNFLDREQVARRWTHFQVRDGDYLLSSSGSLGSVSRATEAVAGAVPYTGILRLWPVDAERTDMEYVRYFMASGLFSAQIRFMKSGVGIEHFGPTHLRRMVIVLPPNDEQRRLVATMAATERDVEASAARVRRETALLHEYRTRLIADVVTGKLDVREAAARLPDEVDGSESLDEPGSESVDESELGDPGLVEA